MFTETDGHVPKKIASIRQAWATRLTSDDAPDDQCDDLLGKFHRFCDTSLSTCTEKNDRSYQLSIDEVCASIDAPEKLRFREISKLDGLETIAGPFNKPGFTDEIIDWYIKQPDGFGETCEVRYLGFDYGSIERSFYLKCITTMENELKRIEFEWNGRDDTWIAPRETCDLSSLHSILNWMISFDKLYERRDKEKFSTGNPLRLDPDTPFTDNDMFDLSAIKRIRFPASYNYVQNEHGVKTLDEESMYKYATDLADFPGEELDSFSTWTLPTGNTIDYTYSYQQIGGSGCWSSMLDTDLYQRAMEAADVAMDLLVGKYTSAGTIKRYAEKLADVPSLENLLPGKCCLDSALNSQFLGINVSTSI